MTRAPRPMVVRGLPAVVAATAMALAPAVAYPGAAMASTAQAKIVSDVPSSRTPNILGSSPDNQVYAIARVGDEIVVGGRFQQVVPPGEPNGYASSHPKLAHHPYIVAFDATTGEIDQSFRPALDGRVTAIVPADDGHSIFVGGYFDQPRKGVAKFDLDKGDPSEPVQAFQVDKLGGRVRDLALANGHLYLAGPFTSVDGEQHHRFAAVKTTNGNVISGVDVQFSGVHNGGQSRVDKIAVTPDGSKLVAIGNFDSVDDETRHQIAMLSLSGDSASLASWDTSGFSHACSTSFDTYMRGVDFSPDGSYFVVVTTGARGSDPSPLCDAASRWETDAANQDAQPSWIDRTGNDTFLSVAITGTAVYVGGHQRWTNNPDGVDDAGQGAVPRPGIVALDPQNGLPFSWDPGRIPRGDGAASLLATDRGLWVGSDTEYIGRNLPDKSGAPPCEEQQVPCYHRQRIAFFPLDGGTPVPANHTAELPGDVYMFGGAGVSRRSFDGQHAGQVQTLNSAQGVDNVTAAVRIDGTLWYGTEDGGFHKRAFGQKTFGKAGTPTPWRDKFDAYPGRKSSFYDEIPGITGMFYARGGLYYTLKGDPHLYYRYFTPESGVVGADRFTIDSGARWADVRGMFRSGDSVYYGTPTGELHRVDFSNGQPGTDKVVSDGGWNAGAMVLVHTDDDVQAQGGGDPSPSPSPTASTTPGGSGGDNGGTSSGSGGSTGPGGTDDSTHARAVTQTTQSDSGDQLPFTGLDLGLLLVAAMVALGGGAGLVLVGRRRRVGAHRGT